ncbi:MAG TPA: isoaspartyl peptidase/L-asparaginase [Catalimonadaceae bacterium]|nr:isoaspartyl peptidase/L-asparaginase [Catalimonadaceae bacterium]
MSIPCKLLIHGGAGTILPEAMSPEKESAYRGGLSKALEAGYSILAGGGPALLAVEEAVKVLEDNPLFNAGKGAVFTHDKKHELDAAIMDGKTRMAGAVAGVTNIKNPVNLALKVMRDSDYVLLTGEGAQQFAAQHGVTQIETSYFYTDLRYQQLLQIIDSNKSVLDHNVAVSELGEDHKKFGTVGAVALDSEGNLAAATSTGGLTNKRFGRVGDSPIIGAGTYANNETCAISATGNGETFIRHVVAYDISCLMAYRGVSLAEACKLVVEKINKADPECGGVIALDSKGNFCFEFNTIGMYRGLIEQEGRAQTAIFRE